MLWYNEKKGDENVKVVEIKENEFDSKVLSNSKKVLVDFYASWCGPCKMLGPVVNKVSLDDDTYDYYKIDIDEASEIARRYGVMSIPTLIVFENGKILKQDLGYKTEDELKEFLEINV